MKTYSSVARDFGKLFYKDQALWKIEAIKRNALGLDQNPTP